MHTRQAVVSFIIGVVTACGVYLLEWPLVAVFSTSVLGYVVTRILLATYGRTQYWLHRGTRRLYSRSCPKCGQYIYRMRGDWLLTCHRCGWRAGLPVVRWLTQSVPARQFRRSVSLKRLLIVGIAGMLIFGNAAGTALVKKSPVVEGLADSAEYIGTLFLSRNLPRRRLRKHLKKWLYCNPLFVRLGGVVQQV